MPAQRAIRLNPIEAMPKNRSSRSWTWYGTTKPAKRLVHEHGKAPWWWTDPETQGEATRPKSSSAWGEKIDKESWENEGPKYDPVYGYELLPGEAREYLEEEQTWGDWEDVPVDADPEEAPPDVMDKALDHVDGAYQESFDAAAEEESPKVRRKQPQYVPPPPKPAPPKRGSGIRLPPPPPPMAQSHPDLFLPKGPSWPAPKQMPPRHVDLASTQSKAKSPRPPPYPPPSHLCEQPVTEVDEGEFPDISAGELMASAMEILVGAQDILGDKYISGAPNPSLEEKFTYFAIPAEQPEATIKPEEKEDCLPAEGGLPSGSDPEVPAEGGLPSQSGPEVPAEDVREAKGPEKKKAASDSDEDDQKVTKAKMKKKEKQPSEEDRKKTKKLKKKRVGSEEHDDKEKKEKKAKKKKKERKDMSASEEDEHKAKKIKKKQAGAEEDEDGNKVKATKEKKKSKASLEEDRKEVEVMEEPKEMQPEANRPPCPECGHSSVAMVSVGLQCELSELKPLKRLKPEPVTVKSVKA